MDEQTANVIAALVERLGGDVTLTEAELTAPRGWLLREESAERGVRLFTAEVRNERPAFLLRGKL